MNKIFVCHEADREVAYINNGGNIRRIQIEQLNEILKGIGLISYDEGIRKGIIQEVDNANPELQRWRSIFVEQQLNGDFLANLDSPLDDDEVCQEMFEQLLTNEKHLLLIRNFRAKKDTANGYIANEIRYKDEAVVFSRLLNKFEYVKMIGILDELSDSGKKILISHANDLDFLENLVKTLYLWSLGEITIFWRSTNREINCSKYPELFLFNDKDIHSLLGIYDKYLNLTWEPMGDKRGINRYMTYESRFYLNSHNIPMLTKFLKYYICECINNNLDYPMKGIYNADEVTNENDTTVLYSENKDLKLRIKIIEKILLEHPELRKAFAQPVYGAARLGTGFYGLGFYATRKENGHVAETQNDYVIHISKIAYFCMLSNVLISNRIISSKDEVWNLANSLCKLQNLSMLANSTNSGDLKFKEKEVVDELYKLEIYTRDPKIIQAMKELGYETFREYMYKIHAFCQRVPVSTNIAIDKGMLEFFQVKKDKVITTSSSPKSELIKKFAQGGTPTPSKKETHAERSKTGEIETAKPMKKTEKISIPKESMRAFVKPMVTDYKAKLVSLCKEIGSECKKIKEANPKYDLKVIESYRLLVIEIHKTITMISPEKITYEAFLKFESVLNKIKDNIKNCRLNLNFLQKNSENDFQALSEVQKEVRHLR